MRLQSLTEDLGTRAFASVTGTLAAGGGALFLVRAAAFGSIEAQLTGGDNVQGDLNLQILDPDSFAVVTSGQPGPTSTAPSAEPNDSIGQANPTGLVDPGSVTIDSTIGDGNFGTTSGDFDFYSFDAAANLRITIEVNVTAVGSELDSLIILYDSSGQILQIVDSAGSGSNEVLTFTTDNADTYSVAVLGWESFPPTDPFTPGTGAGAGSTGDFRVTITTEGLGPGAIEQASLPIQQGEAVLMLVTGADGSSGDFTLEFTNLDQFTTPENQTLFFPAGAGPSQA
ncbi:MAG: PPC domain-containing protein, partial [Chloroflexi bacterium]|nr:PPC domain-containing protein [Chloroflexota bacterium]